MATATKAPTKETLFELGEDLTALDQLLTESLGEITPEIQEWLDEYRTKLEEKVDSVAWFVKTCEARAAGFSKAAEELAAKATTETNKIARLKSYVRACMELRGEKQLKGQVYTFALQQNGGRPPLTLLNENPDAYPPECLKVVRSVDKERVRVLVEAGQVAPELAVLEPLGFHLRLR